MKTDTIAQLREQGFNIEKNSNFQTVVTHNKPFIIHGTSGVSKASLKEGNYSVVFASLCNSGKTPFLIEQTAFPFLNDLHNKHIQKQTHLKATTGFNASKTTITEVTAKDLVEGQVFFKDEECSIKYLKTGPETYRKATQLIETFDLICKPTMTVYVENFDSGLTPEQKYEIVSSIPPGMGYEEFDEILGMHLEDMPGIEMIPDTELANLHRELYDLYRKNA